MNQPLGVARIDAAIMLISIITMVTRMHKLSQTHYLNRREDASPHLELAAPHRDLTSPHRDLSAGRSDKKSLSARINRTDFGRI